MRRAGTLTLLLAAGLNSSARAEPPEKADPPEIRNVRALVVIDHRSGLPGLEHNKSHIVSTLMQADAYTGRVQIDQLGPSDITPQAITDYFKNQNGVSENDGLLFYYAGHGVTQPNAGPFLQTSGGNLMRSALLEAMRTHNPRLIIILTDCCSYASPVLPPPLVAAARPNFVLKDLLFRHQGVVDINASSYDPARAYGEYAWYTWEKGGLFTDALEKAIYNDYQKLDADGNNFVTWNEVFELTQTITLMNYRNLRAMLRQFDEQLLTRDQRDVRMMLINQAAQTPQAFDLGRPLSPLPPGLPLTSRVATAPDLRALGITCRENYGRGLAVVDVSGWAKDQDSGIRAGDIINRINRHDVNTFDGLGLAMGRIAPGDSLLLEGWSGASGYGTPARFTLGATDAARCTSALTAALGDPDPGVRMAAAMALEKIGPNAEATLDALRKLVRGDPHVRWAAASALAEAGAAGIETLGEAARDPDPKLRQAALNGLLHIGARDRRAVQALVDALASDDGNVRMDAMVALGRLRIWTQAANDALKAFDKGGEVEKTQALITLYHLGSRDEQVIAKLLTALDSPNEAIRSATCDVLRSVPGAPAAVVDALAKRLRDPDQKVQRFAAWALRDIGAVRVLADALQDERATTRRMIAQILGPSGVRAAEAIGDLARATHDPVAEVRSAVVECLGGLGPTAMAAIPDLVQALRDQETEVRRCAAFALGAIGPRAEAAIPRLIEALADRDQTVRDAAAVALGKMGPRAVAAVSKLEGLLSSEGMKAAGTALAKIRGVRYLIEFAERKADVTQAAICRSMGDGWAFFPMDVVPFLAAFQDKPSSEARRVAASSLRSIMIWGRVNASDPAAEPALANLCRWIQDETDPKVLVNLIAAVRGFNFGQEVTVAPLMQALKADRPEVRAAATRALGTHGLVAAKVVPALASALRDDSPDVRAAALWALGNLGPSAHAAIPSLVGLLNDSHRSVSYGAAETLSSLGALSELVTALGQGPVAVRSASARGLGKNRGRPVISALLRALEGNEAAEVRIAAARALGGLDVAVTFDPEHGDANPAAPPPRIEINREPATP